MLRKLIWPRKYKLLSNNTNELGDIMTEKIDHLGKQKRPLLQAGS